MRTPAGFLALALVVLGVGACASRPGADSPTPTTTAVAPAPTATAMSEPAPSVDEPTTTPPPTAISPTAAAATALPSSPTPGAEEEPPLAALAAGEGASVTGKLGSWCYGMGCADIVLGPAESLPLVESAAAAEELRVSLPRPYRFVFWRAQYRPADDEDAPLELLAEGGSRYPDPDEAQPTAVTPMPEFSEVAFDAPSGDWVLQVELDFAGGTGSAPYHWHLVVR